MAHQRQPELDALRGLLLLWMTTTHLPTYASHFTNQPFGFVSAAEAFIYVSALLTGRIFGRGVLEEGYEKIGRKVWVRALRLYGYHLCLLGFAFSVLALIAVRTGQPSLQGLLDFYLAHPIVGAISSALLIYRPPLLDILPMYILFLAMTPLAFHIASHRRWRPILLVSFSVWLAAQFGLRPALYVQATHWLHLPIPYSGLGSFDPWAWQFLWCLGLWLGMESEDSNAWLTSRPVVIAAAVIAVAFLLLRHPVSGGDPDLGSFSMQFDKWRLGSLRLLDFGALGILFTAARPKLARWLAIPPLLLLGQASLEVFCAHLLFCFAALALIGDGSDAPAWQQILLLTATFAGLFGVAWVSARMRSRKPAPASVPSPASVVG